MRSFMLVTFNVWRSTVAFVGVSNFNESGTACQTQESFIHNDGQGIQGGCNDCHVPCEHMDENEDNESASFHGEGESTGFGSNDKDNEMNNSEGEGESSDEDGEHDSNDRNDIPIESEEEFGNINFKSLTSSDLMKYHFPDREVAFDFYSWYARFHGFAARKDRTVHNKKDEVIQQTFVCYREGGKIPNQRPLKRAPRKKTRCGCLTSCQVHIWSANNRWYFKKLLEEHNHMLLEEKYVGLRASHRKMSEDDVVQMMNMQKVGIRTPHIYGSFASQMGGYENVRFRKKDIYNEVDKLRRKKGSNATIALSYLQRLKRTDQALYWRHTSGEHGRLQHLFWSDGRCQYDYHVFGDVLAFDATYKKNRYSCPMVVFFGVNHHNQTIVFGCAVVSNETEETYVWVLEQFLHAMKGKVPVSVITDGDLAMRNAIRRVFASAHHRLCAWHLLRNALSNFHNTRFTQLFEECMLGD
ncbi:MULE transposase domain [Sesbania bispinosa]|nr:MULE transposase domain [Sesbania bispinosa]